MMENLTHSKTRVGPKTPKMFGNKRNMDGLGAILKVFKPASLNYFIMLSLRHLASGLYLKHFFSESALGIFLYY